MKYGSLATLPCEGERERERISGARDVMQDPYDGMDSSSSDGMDSIDGCNAIDGGASNAIGGGASDASDGGASTNASDLLPPMLGCKHLPLRAVEATTARPLHGAADHCTR